MQVIAAPGHRVPMQDDPYKHIETDPVEVPDTSYYRRRVAEGELLLAKKARVVPKDPLKESTNDRV